jgi:hypothetical protein
MKISTEAIKKGDLYENTLGHKMAANCDGMLVRLDTSVVIVPDVRMVAILGTLDKWRIKERHA